MGAPGVRRQPVDGQVTDTRLDRDIGHGVDRRVRHHPGLPFPARLADVVAGGDGQRQTIAIARAVLWNSKLVILDEPTAALGVAQTEQVLNLVRRLADSGLAVILISHNMNDVKQVADTVAALYLGQLAATVRADDVTTGQIVELITTGRSGELGLAADREVLR